MKNYLKILFYRINYILIVIHRALVSNRQFNKKNVKKILICETALLGDIVCIHPLINLVSFFFPNATIDILVQKKFKPVAASNPEISNIIVLNDTFMLDIFFLIKKLHKKQFDLIIAPSPGLRNSIITLLSACMKKKTFVTGYLQNNSLRPHFFQNHCAEAPGIKHKFKYYKTEHLTIRAQKSILPLISFQCVERQAKLYLNSAIEQKHRNFLKHHEMLLDGSKTIVIHPASSQPFKIWPVEYFIELIILLQAYFKNQLIIVLIGVGNEKKIISKIKLKIGENIKILLDQPLERIMTLIKNADLFIGNDSGPKFIADGFNIPVIEFMGSLSPKTAGVLKPESVSFYANTRCSPCDQIKCLQDKKCLRLITPECIFNSAVNMLKNISPKNNPQIRSYANNQHEYSFNSILTGR